MTTKKILDIGCGPNKTPGAIGIDLHAYDEVDVVTDLNKTPWPLAAASFDRIICAQVVEHIDDPLLFFREVHRVGAQGCLVELTTPHFSSACSYDDPTHQRHLSAHWCKPLLADGYLSAQIGCYELVSTGVTFGKSLRCFIPRLMIKLKGLPWWEKHYAFTYPAMDVRTVLRVVR